MSEPRTLRLKSGVHASLVGDETIVLSFETGSYFSIRGTGAFIVGALSHGPAVEELWVARLSALYTGMQPEMIERETVAFVDALIAAKIAEVIADSPEVTKALGGHEVPKDAPYGYSPPEEHSELAALITLDPIHEVSPAGWPERA